MFSVDFYAWLGEEWNRTWKRLPELGCKVLGLMLLAGWGVTLKTFETTLKDIQTPNPKL